MSPSEASERTVTMWKDVEASVGECFEAVSHELTFFTLPNCFELFGFDLMGTWPLERFAQV